MSTPKPLPFDTTVSEDRIWEAAGITKADRAEALAHAFHRTREAMDANVFKVFQYQGEVVTSDPMIDHDTRLKAAKQAASFAGVSERNTTPAPIMVSVVMPDWAYGRRTTVNVTPNQVELSIDTPRLSDFILPSTITPPHHHPLRHPRRGVGGLTSIVPSQTRPTGVGGKIDIGHARTNPS